MIQVGMRYNLFFLLWTSVNFSFKNNHGLRLRVYYRRLSSLCIRGYHNDFRFECLCLLFCWNKKSSYVDITSQFFTIYHEKYVRIVYDELTPLWRINPHPMTNQPSCGVDSSLWETFFKRLYLHGYQLHIELCYFTS